MTPGGPNIVVQEDTSKKKKKVAGHKMRKGISRTAIVHS